jgi:hypothetical protein
VSKSINLGCSTHIADYRIACDECQEKYKTFKEKINESVSEAQKYKEVK